MPVPSVDEGKSPPPKVTVCLTTYNQQPYIAQAIEGILMQQTDFEVEILIGEDQSSDGTREIVLAYAERHPQIRLFLNRREDVIVIDGRPTGRWNFANNLTHARGQYVALLEGDDYWTSPHKLQRQADLLDAHPECAICFHPVEKLYEPAATPATPSWDRPAEPSSLSSRPHTRFTLDDLLDHNMISTCATMYRNGLFGTLPGWFYTTPTGDWPLHVLNALHGDIRCLPEPMAVHRVHAGGIRTSRGIADRRKDNVRTLRTFKRNLDPEHEGLLERSLARWFWRVLRALAGQGDLRAMASYAREMLRDPDVSMRALTAAALSLAAQALSTRARRLIRPLSARTSSAIPGGAVRAGSRPSPGEPPRSAVHTEAGDDDG